ncbi:hypothetical protein SUGI_0123080 [Cryptomeria japonica]|nr:hypothetical protein SUGI_0123080 [Cryptomeria japonica]
MTILLHCKFLGNNSLSGPIDHWLFDSNYKIRDLSYNKLTGDIPSEFTSESSKRMNLIGNFLKSPIPNDHSWIAPLQKNCMSNKQAPSKTSSCYYLSSCH